MDSNPYAPPQSSITPPSLPSGGDDEAIRKKHLNQEATIKSVGTLYYLGFFALCGAAFASFNGLIEKEVNPWVMGSIYGVLGILQFLVAYGLRRLKPWSRWPAVAFSCLGLLAFPVGTLINGVILANLLGAKGKLVFSDDYKRITAATPHIKYKSSILVILLAVILLLVLIAIIAAIAIPMVNR